MDPVVVSEFGQGDSLYGSTEGALKVEDELGVVGPGGDSLYGSTEGALKDKYIPAFPQIREGFTLRLHRGSTESTSWARRQTLAS